MDFAEVVATATLAKLSEDGMKTSRRVRAHGLSETGEFATEVAPTMLAGTSILWEAATVTLAL